MTFKLYAQGTLIVSPNPLKFTYSQALPAPTIAALSPAKGPVEGGNAVYITGSNFLGTTDVTFDGVSSDPAPQVVDNSTLIAFPKAHAPGAVTVVVKTASGQGSKAGAYTYEAFVPAPVPVITKAPGSVWAGIGGLVLLEGDNFTGTYRVRVGERNATHFVLSKTRLLINAPGLAKGTYPIRINTEYAESEPSATAQLMYRPIF